MKKQDSGAAFQDTQPEAPMPAFEPYRASVGTRVLYCLALLAMLLSSIGQASSWVGLAMGGGLIGGAGYTVFLLVAAAAFYRIYGVLRYPSALDARPPNAFGQLLRWLALLQMLGGVLGAAGMLLVKPLTLLLFKSGGDAGIAFFIVALYATILASSGWLGCMLFEISRVIGKRVTLPSPPRARRQRLQDAAVFAGLVVLGLALPWILRLAWGDGCPGKTLGACMAKVEGGVKRMAMAPVGAPVVLQSNLEAIEYRHTGGRDWTLTERPALSLLRSGHPVAPQGEHADVRVLVDAVESDGGVLVSLLVTDKGQETASFSMRLKSRARLEAGPEGKRKLVVDLPRNVQPPFGGRRDELLDEIYQQVRAAIGSEREVAEAGMQVKRPSRLITSTALAERPNTEDARPARSCDGILKFEPGKEEASTGHNPSGFLPQLVFVQQPAPSPSVLLPGNDRVGCYGGAVWAADPTFPDGPLHIRQYDMVGVMQRYLLVEIPERKSNAYRFVDEASFVERDGQLEFDLIVEDGVRKYRRERFVVRL